MDTLIFNAASIVYANDLLWKWKSKSSAVS
jgi:hypothetical protein